MSTRTRLALLTLATAAGLGTPACTSATSPGDDVGTVGSAASVTGSEQAAFEYFVGQGLSDFQAAGVVGNLQQESGVDPTSVQYGGGPGRGIAQWSAGGRWDNDAGDNATWYAQTTGQQVLSIGLQLDFVWYELQTFPGYGLAALRASTDVTGATVAFQNDFEGCGQCDTANRVADAEAVLQAFGSGASSGMSPSCTGGGTAGAAIASLAQANVGKGACSTNSLGSADFDSSCTGNGGSPEYWCADFARWVWAASGVAGAGSLTAAAGSFYTYGQANGTLTSAPAVGDAAVFNYHGGGSADHVALVTQVNADGTIETVSGDWGGQGGSESGFSSTSHVVLNAPAYPGVLQSSPPIMGMTISAFVAPVGGTASSSSCAPAGPEFVGVAATPDGMGYWEAKSDGTVTAHGAAASYGSVTQTLAKPVVGIASTPDGKGYWLVAADGGLFAFGDAGFYGSMGGKALNAPVVGMAATATGQGYWMVASDGGLFSFGDAAFYGSMGGKALNKPVVGMAATVTGQGYWMVASDGGLFSFGDAAFYGSMGGKSLNAPVVGMSATPSGKGYWMVASDGGLFAFGDAAFYGSAAGATHAPMVGMASDRGGYWMIASDGTIFTYGNAPAPGKGPYVGLARTPSGNGYWEAGADGSVYAFGDAGWYGSMAGKALAAPAVGIAATPSGQGYWVVAADGGLFSFGDASFYGSMGGKPLNKPVVGIASTPDGAGYWMVAADGGLFAFGDAGFYGSMGGQTLNQPMVGMTSTPDGKGYWMVAADGGLFAFGDAGFYGSMGGKPLNAPVVGMTATASGAGYWMVAEDGGLFAFGDAAFAGSAANDAHAPMTGMAFDGSGGYWMLANDGAIYSFGNAGYHGGAN